MIGQGLGNIICQSICNPGLGVQRYLFAARSL